MGLAVVIVAILFFSTRATAGVVIEDYNSKLNGVQGAITKIEGNKLTLKLTEAGKLIILRVRDLVTYKTTPFKIGDKVKIYDKNLLFNAQSINYDKNLLFNAQSINQAEWCCKRKNQANLASWGATLDMRKGPDAQNEVHFHF